MMEKIQEEVKIQPKADPPQAENLALRPPVVVVLGHVDHGKTTLLDAIRKTRVAEKEAGGITQHIGAYEITWKEKRITFIDTPGHEAFSAMRSRGAHVADIAILVVAADEGVKPQTKEAYEHIQKAEIPFIIAFTKIDKAQNSSEKAKGELSEIGIAVEGRGGTVPSVDVSATANRGISELLDLVLLQAEVEELKTDPAAPPAGVVIEAHLDPRRGKTATLLVLDGKLRRGEELGLGGSKERIKILENDLGKPVEEAAASMPVRVAGLESLPAIGTVFGNLSFSIPAPAKEAPAPQEPGERELVLRPLIIKADVAGSLEAVTEAIEKMNAWNILSGRVGEITESDVKLAAPAGALIIGFRVKAQSPIARLAETLHVEILTKEIIYELLEELERRSKPAAEEAGAAVAAEVSIIALFRQDGNRQIVGGKVTEGELKRGMKMEVIRNGEKIGEGIARELREGKETKESVPKGRECGILVEGTVPIHIGDILRVSTT